jgi:hypothetical protein
VAAQEQEEILPDSLRAGARIFRAALAANRADEVIE